MSAVLLQISPGAMEGGQRAAQRGRISELRCWTEDVDWGPVVGADKLAVVCPIGAPIGAGTSAGGHPASEGATTGQLWCVSTQMAQSLGIAHSSWSDKVHALKVPQLCAYVLKADGSTVGTRQVFVIPLSALPALGRAYKPQFHLPLSEVVLRELDRLATLTAPSHRYASVARSGLDVDCRGLDPGKAADHDVNSLPLHRALSS